MAGPSRARRADLPPPALPGRAAVRCKPSQATPVPQWLTRSLRIGAHQAEEPPLKSPAVRSKRPAVSPPDSDAPQLWGPRGPRPARALPGRRSLRGLTLCVSFSLAEAASPLVSNPFPLLQSKCGGWRLWLCVFPFGHPPPQAPRACDPPGQVSVCCRGSGVRPLLATPGPQPGTAAAGPFASDPAHRTRLERQAQQEAS